MDIIQAWRPAEADKISTDDSFGIAFPEEIELGSSSDDDMMLPLPIFKL
jgi:hypothetical protein